MGFYSILVIDRTKIQIQKILQGPVGDALVSLHISDSFQGARVPEGEEQEAPSQAVIFVFDMIDTEKCALQFLKVRDSQVFIIIN